MHLRQCHSCHDFSGPAPESDDPSEEWICAECISPSINKMERIEQGLKNILQLFKVKYDPQIMKEVLNWVQTESPQTRNEIIIHCSQQGEVFFHHLMAASAMELVAGVGETMGWEWTDQAKKVMKKWL